MAFERHNIEKRRLIELVRLNPILWDCRLPHYKRSDKKKAVKWNELGRIFNVNGERVQRTFTSLREIFRRELNHEKLLGTRFKSKWEYYDAMAFLKEVIRERKSRERVKPGELQQMNNSSTGIDEYQYFAPNDPNNPNNQQQLPQALQQNILSTPLQPPIPSQQHQQQQHQQPQLQQHQHQTHLPLKPPLALQSLQLQPDVILSLNASALCALQKLSTNGGLQQQQQQQQQLQPSLESPHAEELLSTSSVSSSPSIYIKDEPDSQDDTISLATTLNEKVSNSPKTPPLTLQHQRSRKHSKVGNSATLKALRNSRPTKKSLHSEAQLVIDEDAFNDVDALGIDDVDAGDDDPDPDVDMGGGGRSLSAASTIAASIVKLHRPSAREILYTKFGDFLAARLNTLHDASAHDLMNRILLLIAEK